MITIYPIYQSKDIENWGIEINMILNNNWKKFIDKFNRISYLVYFYTKKYYVWEKIYKNSDPTWILRRFNIDENSNYNIGGITVKKAIQNWVDYMNWKIKYL